MTVPSTARKNTHAVARSKAHGPYLLYPIHKSPVDACYFGYMYPESKMILFSYPQRSKELMCHWGILQHVFKLLAYSHLRCIFACKELYNYFKGKSVISRESVVPM